MKEIKNNQKENDLIFENYTKSFSESWYEGSPYENEAQTQRDAAAEGTQRILPAISRRLESVKNNPEQLARVISELKREMGDDLIDEIKPWILANLEQFKAARNYQKRARNVDF